MAKELQAVESNPVVTVENNFRFIELEVREIEVKKNDGSINKFYAYKGFLKNGKKIDVKFTKEAQKSAPEEDMMIKVNLEDMNIDKNRKYPVLWVKKIIEVLPLPKLNRKPEDYKELQDSFNDLPF